jgi:hypothetical protein
MSLRTTIRDLLANDATIQSLLPGGVHTNIPEITRQDAQDAFADGELLPCALVKVTTENAIGPHRDTAETFFTVYYYQRRGYDAIDAARFRGWQLLHRQRISGTIQVFAETFIPGQHDPALDANLHLDRYRAVRTIRE